MIQSNELRLGNFIYKFGVDYVGDNPIVDRDDFEIIKVDIDVLKNIQDFNGTTDFYYTEPIPLTEEILLKCGGYIYNGWDDMQFFRFDDFHLKVFELEIQKDGFYYDDTKIEFLHDLQNCYYFHANQKKELTFNNL